MTKGQETRERIVMRAAELFNMNGFSGTAIADVMAAVELEKGGIYRHFASKDELALAAFDYSMAQVRGRVTAAVAGAGRATDGLLGVVEVFRGYVGNPPLAGGCPIMNTAIDSDDGHPLLRDRARAALGELHELLHSLAQRAIAQGELRPDLEPARLATVIIATMEGAVMMSLLLRDPQPLIWAADHMHDHILAQTC